MEYLGGGELFKFVMEVREFNMRCLISYFLSIRLGICIVDVGLVLRRGMP